MREQIWNDQCPMGYGDYINVINELIIKFHLKNKESNESKYILRMGEKRQFFFVNLKRKSK